MTIASLKTLDKLKNVSKELHDLKGGTVLINGAINEIDIFRVFQLTNGFGCLRQTLIVRPDSSTGLMVRQLKNLCGDKINRRMSAQDETWPSIFTPTKADCATLVP